jgi:LysR family transcriptional regulator of gallate degradation
MEGQAALPGCRHLRIFEAVARTNNIGRAAASIHLSQPAVTQSIAKLEAWAGVRLFARSQAGSFPTEAGEALLARVERYFAIIESALQSEQVGLSSLHKIRAVIPRLTGANIRALISTSTSRSFEEAAEALCTSRSSLQRSARDIERAVGVALYKRTQDGITVNAAGLELGRCLQLAAAEIIAAAEDMRDTAGIHQSLVTLGCQPLASRILLASAINELLERCPAARFKIVEGDYSYLLNELRFGRIDLMFGSLKRPKNIADVVEEPLFADSYCIVVRRQHPLVSRRPLTLKALTEYDWIMPGEGTGRRRAFEILFGNTASRPTTCIDASSLATHAALLASSNRITLLTKFELAMDPRASGLVALPIKTMLGRSPDGVTARSNWRPNVVHKEFLKILRQRAGEVGGSLRGATEGRDAARNRVESRRFARSIAGA